MGVDVTLIRRLAGQVHAWPGASDEARRLASVLWHDAPGAGDLTSVAARLTGEMRACRYAEDEEMPRVLGELRRQVAALADEAASRWPVSAHDVFAARTRAAARYAGLDLG